MLQPALKPSGLEKKQFNNLEVEVCHSNLAFVTNVYILIVLSQTNPFLQTLKDGGTNCRRPRGAAQEGREKEKGG